MVHKPKHRVHSFRGLLAGGGQDKINLERQNVNLAYRIIKFQTVNAAPGTQDIESITQTFRERQDSVVATVDFTNPDLLGVAVYRAGSSLSEPNTTTIIFDNILFSRNIFVTTQNVGSGTDSINYYIEIEEVPVNAATLMQIKLGTARRLVGGSMGHA